MVLLLLRLLMKLLLLLRIIFCKVRIGNAFTKLINSSPICFYITKPGVNFVNVLLAAFAPVEFFLVHREKDTA